MSGKERVLVVTDEKTNKILLVKLEKKGYQVDGAFTVQEAFEKARLSAYNFLLLDIKLPDIMDIEMLLPFRESQPGMEIIYFASIKGAIKAIYLYSESHSTNYHGQTGIGGNPRYPIL